jgi:hypothetical protein
MIQYIGGAVTSRPAGYEQTAGNQMMYICSVGGTGMELSESYVNSLPDDSFLFDRRLPIKDENGNLSLIHLYNALRYGIDNKDDQVLSKVEPYYYRLKDGADVDVIGITVNTASDAKSVSDAYVGILSDGDTVFNDKGGKKMPDKIDKTYTQLELDTAVSEAKKSAVDEAIKSGDVVDAKVLEGMVKKEDVDRLVAEAGYRKDRESKVASLGLDKDMTADYMRLAGTFDLTKEGQDEFDKSYARWVSVLKKDATDKKVASDDTQQQQQLSDEDNFNPGSGGGGNDTNELVGLLRPMTTPY